MKRLSIFWVLIGLVLFYELLFRGYVAVPADTLVGAYLPWREYKWGYVVGVPVKNALISDVFSQFFIWKHLAADIFHSGQLPLLNQFSFSGNPLLATYHTSILFPASILVYLLPRFAGWNLYIALSTIVAGLSMSFYLRHVLKNLPAAIAGGVVFALSGPMTTWFEFGTAVWGMALFPLCLYLIDKINTAPRQIYYLTLACLTATVSLSGNVQILTYFSVLISAYVLYTFWPIKNLIRRSKLLILVLLAGMGLSAIQLLPTADMYQTSIRAGEQYAKSFNYGLSSWDQIIRLWSADFYGNPVTSNHRGPFSYHEYTGFLGTLAVCLILAFLTRAKKYPLGIFFAFVFLVSLLLAFVHPLSQYIFSLPLPLFTYSSASRLFFIVALTGAILTAFSLRELLVDRRFSRNIFFSSTFLVLISGIFLIFTPAEFQLISLRNSAIPVCLLLVIAFTCLLNFRRGLIAIYIIIALVFDLGRYFRKYNPFVPARLVFPATQTTDFLQKNAQGFRIINESDEAMPPNTWAYYGISSAEGYDPLYSLDYNRLLNVVNLQGYFNSPSRYLDLTNANPLFLDILNVKYLVAQTPEKSVYPLVRTLIKAGWTQVFSEGSTHLYENPRVLPRAFFVSHSLEAYTEAEIARHLEDPEFNPRTTAIIPANLSLSPLATLPSVNRVIVTTSKITVDTDGSDSGLLVLSQSFDQGWKASLDGQSVSLLRANGGLMAVQIPPGTHTLRVGYLPDSVVYGAIISALSLTGLMGLYFFRRKF